MPVNQINGINLYWEMAGSEGEPIVFVHGSWGDHHNWDAVVGDLSKSFRVVTYDRRGHSESQRLNEQGNLEQDADDLAALVEFLNISPAHIVGNSGGAAVALKTAAIHPHIFKTLVVHEPPLFDLLKNDAKAAQAMQAVDSRIDAVVQLIKKERNEEAAKLFVETIAFGPGGWEKLPPAARQTFVYNAPTFYDETKDPESLWIDTNKLTDFHRPVLLTSGTESAPFFPWVVDKLAEAMPHAKRYTFEGAGHVPHMSHSAKYVEVIKKFCFENH
jgi:pimeloyl-ACP methyl ester carboxylesterase